MKLEENLKYSLLAEIYGALLTSKQQKLLKDFLDNNISISELAVECKSSRQAVNDLIKRTFKVLDDYERKLKFFEKFETIKKDINCVCNLVEKKDFDCEELKRKLNSILEVL